MTLDEKLEALRQLMQQDVGARGLAGEVFAACAGDLARACRSLAHAQAVEVVTGFPIPPDWRYETDGPPGAHFLLRCLHHLGIPARVVTEERLAHSLNLALPGPWATSFEKAQRDPWPQAHVVAIERPGPAVDGRCYSMRGIDLTLQVTDLRPFLAGRPFLAIGDGGNEAGMGKVPAEVLARNIPNGSVIACRLPADHLLVAGVSNWGAWALGIGTCLARSCPLPPLDAGWEREPLEALVSQGGLIDGVTGRAEASVDGVPFGLYIQPLLEMRKVAEA
jgi:hypothetical protein